MGQGLGKRTEWYRSNASSRPGERGGAPFFSRGELRERERSADVASEPAHAGVVATATPGDNIDVPSLGKKRTELQHTCLHNIVSTMAWIVVERVKCGRMTIAAADGAA